MAHKNETKAMPIEIKMRKLGTQVSHQRIIIMLANTANKKVCIASILEEFHFNHFLYLLKKNTLIRILNKKKINTSIFDDQVNKNNNMALNIKNNILIHIDIYHSRILIFLEDLFLNMITTNTIILVTARNQI